MHRLVTLAACTAVVSGMPRASDGSAFVGKVYSVSLNGTTNELNFLVADLNTFVVEPLGDPISGEVVGSSSVILNDTFWFNRMTISPDAITLCGIDITTGDVKYNMNTGQWSSYPALFIDALFPVGDDTLFAVTHEPKYGITMLFNVFPGNSSVSLLSSMSNSTPTGSDPAWDPVSRRLYLILSDGNDEDSGSLQVLDLSDVQRPTIIGSIPLQDHYSLPIWDATTSSLFGLTVLAMPDGTYQRNVTQLWVADPAGGQYNATDRGSLGSFYVLFDGPKAFDPVGRRLFYLLSTSPMGEMDLTAVQVDANGGPAKILETPGICGFIGYCPQAIAYYPS